MLRIRTCLQGAVVVGLIAALAPAVASLWANPLQQARATQRAETPGEAQLIGTPLTAGACPGPGNCCVANGTPGCNDFDCCDFICFIDSFCCDVGWDQNCADLAIGLCDPDACSGTQCPGAGSCFEPNGTPGCDDLDCCELICGMDTFCCDVVWDQLCADEAIKFCKGGPDPCPWDLDDSGDVGVKDLLFLLGAWGPCPKKGECPADFDNSGDVGVKDLLFLLGAWGPCP